MSRRTRSGPERSGLARRRSALRRASEPETAVATQENTAQTDLTIGVVPKTTDEFDELLPRGLQLAASWAWRLILVIALLGALGWLASYLSEVMIPLAVAVLLSALLYPVANRLHKWGMPRGPASALSVLGGLALIAGALTLIGNQIAGQAGSLTGNLVTGFDQLVIALKGSSLPINPDWFQVDQWTQRIQEFVLESQSTIAIYAQEIGTQVGRFLAGLAIMLFALFYFLYQGRRIFEFLLRLMPQRARDPFDSAAQRGWRSLASYVRATILVALTDGVGVLIVALILGVPLAPALAALVFIGAFVPLVGALVSGFVAVIVALVALGWFKALIMLGGIILVMQIEGHVLQPFLLGRAVHLHPLAVLLAIAVGIIVAGIVGALFAVPMLAFAKTFIEDLHTAPEDPEVIDGGIALEPD